MSAIEDIAAERKRQIEVEGWTAEHDDGHWDGEMARAAASYALNAGLPTRFFSLAVALRGFLSAMWPWDFKWWKPSTPRRDLVKAGALIVAEIERIDRAAARESK